MTNLEQEWQKYLENGYTVIMDNDEWWFQKEVSSIHFDYESTVISSNGGSGPYGVDLLEYLLKKHYSGMEWV